MAKTIVTVDQGGTGAETASAARTALGAAADAFTQTGTGAVATTVDAKLKDVVSVEDFGATGDGTTDDTAAIQAAIEASFAAQNNIVYFPAGRYLITDQIDLHPGTKLKGANMEKGGTFGATSFPNRTCAAKGTTIIFDPSTEKSLFVPVTPAVGSSAYTAIAITDMNIWGNTTPNAYWRGIYSSTFPDDVSTSLYAIDFNSTQASNVENVSINGFQYGVREGHRCQVNTYTNLHISYIRFACILYSAAESAAEPTDSVWTRCHFNTCQHVVKTTYDSTVGSYSGDSLQIRFDCCEFMNTSDTVFILTDRAKDWVVVNCYAENVCADATVTGRCMFDVGSTGVGSLQTNPSLLISGGQYAGDSNSGSTFLKTDYTAGVSLIGTVAKRFGTGISCTTNTRANSIYVSNYQCITVTTEFSGTDGKLVGIVRSLDLADGNDSIFLKVPYITYPTGVQITGPTLTLGDSSTASVYVVDGADLGVGEASPTSPLHTAGTTNDGSSLVQFFQSGTGRAIHVVRNVAAATRQMVNFAQLSATGGSTAVVHIQQADTGETALAISTDGSTEKFTVSDVGDVYAAGSVGIGTSVPTHKLHNTGTTRLDARVTVKKSSNSEFATTIVTSGSAIAIDLDDADNFNVTLNASAALSNPTNITVGQSGCIVITHGSTLTDISSWGSYWHFEEGTAPTLSEDAVVDNLVYFVASATSIHAVLLKDMS